MKETRDIVSAQFFDNYHTHFFIFWIKQSQGGALAYCPGLEKVSRSLVTLYFQFDTIYLIVQTCSS